MTLHSPVIITDARPKIVDASLTLIFRMGQEACRMRFYQLRWPLLPLWMDAIMQLCDCGMGKTVNHWRSIDAHLRAILGDMLTVIGCATIVRKMYKVYSGSQYSISMYYYLHPKASCPLSVWATTIHIIWMMNDVGVWRFSIFGQQFMV